MTGEGGRSWRNVRERRLGEINLLVTWRAVVDQLGVKVRCILVIPCFLYLKTFLLDQSNMHSKCQPLVLTENYLINVFNNDSIFPRFPTSMDFMNFVSLHLSPYVGKSTEGPQEDKTSDRLLTLKFPSREWSWNFENKVGKIKGQHLVNKI